MDTEDSPGPLHPWPEDWSVWLGARVTLEGQAANAKLGALLLGDHGAIGIDGLQEWPEPAPRVSSELPRVRVTGTVIRRDDVPVFVWDAGAEPRAGVPAQSEGEADKLRWRYLLAEAVWRLVE